MVLAESAVVHDSPRRHRRCRSGVATASILGARRHSFVSAPVCLSMLIVACVVSANPSTPLKSRTNPVQTTVRRRGVSEEKRQPVIKPDTEKRASLSRIAERFVIGKEGKKNPSTMGGQPEFWADDDEETIEEVARSLTTQTVHGESVKQQMLDEETELVGRTTRATNSTVRNGGAPHNTTDTPTAAPAATRTFAPISDTVAPVAVPVAKPVRQQTNAPSQSPTESPTDAKDGFDPDEGKTEQDDIFDKDFYNNMPPNDSAQPQGFSVFATLIGIAAMIFTAWQMSDNPDGIFASLCRLIITSIQLLCRIISSPCRKCMPCCFPYGSSGGSGFHEPYGHMPVSTMDYGYKDPTLELS